MTTSTKQRLLIAFSCVLVGCAVGATMPRIAAQSYPQSPTAQRWEQFCEDTGESEQQAVNRSVNAHGREGFELVSTSFWGTEHLWACYKRPAAR